MAITYLKRAEKTPATGNDETRATVERMLAEIETGGDAAALKYGAELDGYTGDPVVTRDQIEAAAAQVPEQLKSDIQFAYERVTRFAEAQESLGRRIRNRIVPGLWAGQKLIPIETAGCYVPGDAMRTLPRPLCPLPLPKLRASNTSSPVLPRAAMTA